MIASLISDHAVKLSGTALIVAALLVKGLLG